MTYQVSRFITFRIESFVLKAGAALAPLLLMLALGGAQPAEAASSTVVVAPTPNPTNCGSHHSAVTDLEQVLSTTKKGIILVCPGTYALAGEIRIIGASNLTIKNAVKGLNVPLISFSDTAHFGLSIQNSKNVTLDGLNLDAPTNTQTFFVMVAFSESNGSIRNGSIVGGNPFNTGVEIDNTTKTLHTFTLSKTEISHAAQGMNVSGLVKLNVTSSTIDGESVARGTVNTGIALEADQTSLLHPTGTISKSTIRDNNVGILIDGSQLTISNNSFTGNTAVNIHIDQVGDLSPVIRNNKIIHNHFKLEQGTNGVLITLSGDPTTARLLDTTVSQNIFERALGTQVDTDFGIVFQSMLGPAPKSLTGTVSGNILTDLLPANAIVNVNNWATLKLSHNKLGMGPA